MGELMAFDRMDMALHSARDALGGTVYRMPHSDVFYGMYFIPAW
jgi:hypothetical protein